MQSVGELLCVGVDDTLISKVVHTHLPRRMYYASLTHVNTHMNDAAGVVGKETKVIASGMLKAWYYFPLGSLL